MDWRQTLGLPRSRDSRSPEPRFADNGPRISGSRLEIAKRNAGRDPVVECGVPPRLRARTTSVLTTLFALLSFAEESFAVQEPSAPRQPPSSAASTRPPAIFLDCESCFVDYLRAEVTFVDFVRDRTEADVHVLITRAGTGAGGSEYTLQFIGARAFADLTETIRTVTTSSDSEDQVRRQLATALRVGLLRYLSREACRRGWR